MTEQEFKQLLSRLDEVFLPRQIGSNGTDWIAVGRPLVNEAPHRIRVLLKGEPVEVDVHQQGDDVYLKAAPEDEPIVLRLPKIPPVHIILFLLTIFTTLTAGALMEGVNLLENPAGIARGIPFSLTLLLILGTHEFGHYYFARKHHVDATLPYFIPAPTFIGTFGAFIKIKSPIYRKSALLQIGAAGPIAGFLIAVPALWLGLSLSTVVPTSPDALGIQLGDSLLMKALTALTFPGLEEGQDVLLHPIAFAGWIGLLVTMLNLLPVGQLDGGHIAYAMLGRAYARVARMTLLALLPLSYFSLNWLVWGALILLLMRTPDHPPVMDVDAPLDPRDRRIGYLCLAIFILCFIPAPFPG
ncbi:MAG: site-2 protease family protein [Candidatus Neomarinimicrobiota bacterium]|nr:MAG: site-2 protease family protein [Candidatus Neomarinimicrobiota bacterium]